MATDGISCSQNRFNHGVASGWERWTTQFTISTMHCMTLAELFPDGEYRFQLRFARGNPAEYFQAMAQHDSLIAQRRHWLQTSPGTYSALLPEGIPLLEEAIEFATASHAFPRPRDDLPAAQRCAALGQFWEPDYLLLKPDGAGEIRPFGGCVCFPSSWKLNEKMGHPIEFIHGVVPGLNASIGVSIHSFLSKLKPGIAWLRTNWGLSRSPELNQHPDRNLPRLDASVRADEVWLRVEHQALVALPKTGGILFGIRIAVHPLAEVREDRDATGRLARALQTMPEEVARYKGLADARERLIQLLR